MRNTMPYLHMQTNFNARSTYHVIIDQDLFDRIVKEFMVTNMTVHCLLVGCGERTSNNRTIYSRPPSWKHWTASLLVPSYKRAWLRPLKQLFAQILQKNCYLPNLSWRNYHLRYKKECFADFYWSCRSSNTAVVYNIVTLTVGYWQRFLEMKMFNVSSPGKKTHTHVFAKKTS